MGGDVSVSSTVGKGTIVKFDVPLCLAQSQEVQTPQKPRRVIGLSPDQPNYRILVVDDVKVSRLLLVKLLTSTGFEVREAKDGLEAIALWESWKPHLILMDVQMPEMDGCEATRQIKSREKERGRGKDGENRQSPIPNSQSSIPNPQSQTIIIALTANAFEEDRAVVLAAGCDDFISKPFQEETIFGKIARYLGVRYIYEEPAHKSAEIEPQGEKNLSDRPLEDYLSKMPAEWVKQLYQEAITGSDCQIFNLIEQIPSNHAPLRHALMDWVKDFDFERVIDLIKQVSNEGKEN
jgi:two-component system sensor histidine kinase/response regulator